MPERREVPHGPENPDLDWFLQGTIDVGKLNNYTLSLSHWKGGRQAKLWRSVFGLERGDGQLLAGLIMEQLVQVEEIEESNPKPFREDPSRQARRWRLDIPRFRGPNGRVARVRTDWALHPDNDRPHLGTALVKLTSAERRRSQQE
jgi:hypothetical protein